jgi:hypothetical protein
LPVDLVDRRAGRQPYAHVMGLDRATGKWFFLAPDAKTRVYPGSPNLGDDIAAQHGNPARLRRRREIDRHPGDGQRPDLLLRRPFAEILRQPGRRIVLPSVTDPNDANAAVAWGFSS